MDTQRSGGFRWHALAFGVSSIWATTYAVTKVLLHDLSPVDIIVYRFILACIALFLLYPRLFHHGGGWKTERFFALAGLLGVASYFLLENTALVHTYASNASVILGAVPFLTGLTARIFLKEPLHRGFVPGFAVAMVGIALISFSGSQELGLNPFGDFLAFCAGCSWALYSVVSRKISDMGFDNPEATRHILLWGIVWLLPAFFLQCEPIRLPDLTNPVHVASFLFLGLLASGGCYTAWNRALHHLGAVKCTAYIYITPAIAVVMAWLVLDEVLTPTAMLGTLLTLVGLAISEYEALLSIIKALHLRKSAAQSGTDRQ